MLEEENYFLNKNNLNIHLDNISPISDVKIKSFIKVNSICNLLVVNIDKVLKENLI